jgi:hypothetical protein
MIFFITSDFGCKGTNKQGKNQIKHYLIFHWQLSSGEFGIDITHDCGGIIKIFGQGLPVFGKKV